MTQDHQTLIQDRNIKKLNSDAKGKMFWNARSFLVSFTKLEAGMKKLSVR